MQHDKYPDTLGGFLHEIADDLDVLRVKLWQFSMRTGRHRTYKSLQDDECRELAYQISILEEAMKWADELTPEDAKQKPDKCPGTCGGTPSSVWQDHGIGWLCRECGPPLECFECVETPSPRGEVRWTLCDEHRRQPSAVQ